MVGDDGEDWSGASHATWECTRTSSADEQVRRTKNYILCIHRHSSNRTTTDICRFKTSYHNDTSRQGLEVGQNHIIGTEPRVFLRRGDNKGKKRLVSPLSLLLLSSRSPSRVIESAAWLAFSGESAFSTLRLADNRISSTSSVSFQGLAISIRKEHYRTVRKGLFCSFLQLSTDSEQYRCYDRLAPLW